MTPLSRSVLQGCAAFVVFTALNVALIIIPAVTEWMPEDRAGFMLGILLGAALLFIAIIAIAVRVS